MVTRAIYFSVILSVLVFYNCSSSKKHLKKNRPYEYGWVPKSYKEIEKNYDNYSHLLGCQSNEKIASIGAGNGVIEAAISCFEENIQWHLQEIDTSKLNQFEKVQSYFEQLKGDEINAEFNFVIGTETETMLPEKTFDRIIMNNVYHELSESQSVMTDILKKLTANGQLVIMEPMAKKQGDMHANCNHLRLWEPVFLSEMDRYGYLLSDKKVGEKISFLTFYTFTAK